MERPIEVASLGEVFASTVQIEDAGDGLTRISFSARRGKVLVEAVSVIIGRTGLQELRRAFDQPQLSLTNH